MESHHLFPRTLLSKVHCHHTVYYTAVIYRLTSHFNSSMTLLPISCKQETIQMSNGTVRLLDKKCCIWIKILSVENISYFHFVVKFIKNLQGTILVTNMVKRSGFISEFTVWLTLSCILLGHYGTPSHTHCWGTKGTAGEDREYGVRNITFNTTTYYT